MLSLRMVTPERVNTLFQIPLLKGIYLFNVTYIEQLQPLSEDANILGTNKQSAEQLAKIANYICLIFPELQHLLILFYIFLKGSIPIMIQEYCNPILGYNYHSWYKLPINGRTLLFLLRNNLPPHNLKLYILSIFTTSDGILPMMLLDPKNTLIISYLCQYIFSNKKRKSQSPIQGGERTSRTLLGGPEQPNS